MNGLDTAQILDLVRRNKLVPESCIAVFVGGSVSRGWQHARSDADLYVVSTEPWTGETNGFNPVGLEPDAVPTSVVYLENRRWEVRYWLDTQVSQAFAKASWEAFQQSDPVGQKIGTYEALLLSRINKALPLVGADWLAARRRQLGDSAFRAMLIQRALGEADGCVEDALGMLEAGDTTSAVLAAQLALAASADALTLSHGEYSIERKWRARRMRAIVSPSLPFDLYWELATMQSFVPEQPHQWIQAVLDVCRQTALDIEI